MLRSILCSAFVLTGLAGAPLAAVERTAESAVTPVANARHEGFLAQIREAKGDFDLLLVGDSITDWWPKKGTETYPQVLAWKPLNLGVAGERTEQVLWRLENGELEGIKPKACMVMIGTNNLGQIATEKPAWVAAGVAKIIATIQAKLPDTPILLLAIFPRGEKPTDSIRLRVSETNALLARLADGKRVVFQDIGSQLLEADGTLSKSVMPDFLHPNEEGYRRWLAAVKPTLTAWIGGQGP